MLSHYTSLAGLQGIAKSKTLWATDFLDVNDETELLYGLTELMRRGLSAAYAECALLLKPDEIREIDNGEVLQKLTDFYRDLFRNKPSEHLHVVSFAKSNKPDHEKRGLLTLWSRYTGNQGYCLQYDESDVLRTIGLEAQSRAYAFMDLARIHYGFDESELEYSEILLQIKLRLLGEVHRERQGLGVDPHFDDWWPESIFATRMFAYCAKHKDPFFEDEREVRIMAVPAITTTARPFTAARIKRVEQHNGKRFIDIGADWRPGLEPRRIIVGPSAKRDITHIVDLFERKPSIVYADFPIRGSCP